MKEKIFSVDVAGRYVGPAIDKCDCGTEFQILRSQSYNKINLILLRIDNLTMFVVSLALDNYNSYFKLITQQECIPVKCVPPAC